MLCQFHGVVQHPTDLDEPRFKAVNKEMPRSAIAVHAGLNMSPTQSQVPGWNTCAKFRPSETARSLGRGCNIEECGDNQSVREQSGTDKRSTVGKRKVAVAKKAGAAVRKVAKAPAKPRSTTAVKRAAKTAAKKQPVRDRR